MGRKLLHRTKEELTNSRVRSARYYTRHKDEILEKRAIYNNKNGPKINQRRSTKKRKLTIELKTIAGGKCSRCSYDKCLAALCFHHTDDNKEGEVSQLIRKGRLDEARREAKKCILLCANCHAEEHYPDK